MMEYCDGSDTPVVLFSYRRPELTGSAIRRIATSWPGPVLVSIDGPRASATEEELEWRSQTVAVAELEASRFSNVDVRAWNSNHGLTHHARRIFRDVMEIHESVIAVEEDIALSGAGLLWLARVGRGPDPALATAMTRFEHAPRSTASAVRKTAFPSQWSTAFNRALFLEFDRVCHERQIRQSVIDQVIDAVIPNRLLAWSARDFWSALFREAATSANHGDALFQYASWSLGCLALVPDQSQVTDLGPTDYRGLHQRLAPDDEVNIHRPVPIVSDETTWVCASCEMNSQERFGVNAFSPVRRRLRIRTRLAQLRKRTSKVD